MKNVAISLLCLSLFALSALPAAGDPPAVEVRDRKEILVLFPFAPDYPAWTLFMTGLNQGFGYEKAASYRFIYEFLGANLAGQDPAFLETTARYFRYKYGVRRPDIVVASTMLESFISDYGDLAFPGLPIVVASTEATPLKPTENELLHTLSGPYDFLKTVKLALDFRPDTKRVYFVLGSSPYEAAAAMELRRLSRSVADRVAFVILQGLSHDELLDRIAKAPGDSAVVFCWFFSDANGDEYKPSEVVREVVAASPVPVYGIERQYLGCGIVGGYLWSMATYGKNVAINALGILDGLDSGVPKFSTIEASAYGIDWNALRRWKMNPASVPGNATIVNGSHGFLEIYGVYVLIFSLLVAVLAVMAVILGIFAIGKRQAERELDVVSLRLSLALKEGAELNRRLDSRALRDPHTGLFIRKHVDERIDDEFTRYEKTGAQFSLIQVDVDSFGTVNDRFGKETGNILLSRIAGELIKLVRLYDVLARWSGEEFMILLPDTDEDTAVAFAERIRKAVSGAVYFEQEHKLVVTISCGVASSADAQSVAELIRNVGAALDAAQRNGKNRVVRYTSVPST